MGAISVAQAAERLGVSVPRVHQRIKDGSLTAERLGSQWVVDERSVLHVQERSKPGRPLSARSAWAVIALSEHGGEREHLSGSAARGRAGVQLRRLLDPGESLADGEDDAAVSLRTVFRHRAQRRALRAAPADLAGLRADHRWAMLIDPGSTGIASPDVEGYLGSSAVEEMVRDHLLVEALGDENVVIHVIADGQDPYPESRLRLAADLAEHRRPREEARAAALLHELREEWRAAGR